MKPVIEETAEGKGAEETPFEAVERVIAERKRLQNIRSFLLKTLFYCSISPEKRNMSYRVIENSRNERGCYNASSSISGSVTFPGATQLAIAFDERTQTEARRDLVCFYA